MQNIITIGGQQRPVKFNYKAIKTYEQVSEDSYLNVITEIADGNPKVSKIMALLYAGLIGAGVVVSLDEVAEWAIGMNAQEYLQFYKIFFDSMPQTKELNKEKEEATQETVGE